jgi:hypothetical protein
MLQRGLMPIAPLVLLFLAAGIASALVESSDLNRSTATLGSVLPDYTTYSLLAAALVKSFRGIRYAYHGDIMIHSIAALVRCFVNRLAQR